MTGSGGRRAKLLPPCALKPHTLSVATVCGAVHSADQLTKPAKVHIKGREPERMLPLRYGPFRVRLPMCFHTCCRHSSELWVRFLFSLLYKSDFKNTDQDRLFYFTFLYISPSSFSHLTKKRSPTPKIPLLLLCKTENGNTLL